MHQKEDGTKSDLADSKEEHINNTIRLNVFTAAVLRVVDHINHKFCHLPLIAVVLGASEG